MLKPMLMVAVAAMGASTMMAAGLKTGELTNVTRLTNDNGVKYENPTFSPNGLNVAFTKFGYEGLYAMNPDGTNKRQLSDAAGVGYMYQWNISSNQILARDTRWGDDNGTVSRAHSALAIGLDGTVVKLTDDLEKMQPAAWRYGADGSASIAIDGQLQEAPQARRVNMPAANNGAKAVLAVPLNLTTSFITDADNLYVVDNQGRKTNIFNGAALHPMLSPDGTRVVFYGEGDMITVMNIDGTNKRQLVKGQTPSWLNDDQIIYERTTDDGHTYLTGELYIINADGSGAEKALTATPGRIEMNAAVSPDGNRVLFTDFNDGQVYIADIK